MKREYLSTWEFGCIPILSESEITIFDTYIRNDDIDEWSYYQLADGRGTIVAVPCIAYGD